MRRRSVLSLLGLGGVGVLTAKGLSGCVAPGGNSSGVVKGFPFQPVRVPLPVNSDGPVSYTHLTLPTTTIV